MCQKCGYNFAIVVFKKYFIMIPNVSPVTYRWSSVFGFKSTAKLFIPNLQQKKVRSGKEQLVCHHPINKGLSHR